jgi:type VI secretion system secreted protein Hcp
MASDFFLKITGDSYKGESKDKTHKDEIQCLSWNWGESNSGTFGAGGGGGAGKVNFQDFSFTMYTCKASPNLMLACANGTHIDDATLTCRKAGKEQQEFLVIKFSKLLISSYSLGGGGDEVPIESITFNFAKIDIAYKPQKPDGTLDSAIKANYDIEAQESA